MEFNKEALAIDPEDQVVKYFAESFDTTFIKDWKDLKKDTSNKPVIFRSMSQRSTVKTCKKQSRDFYYIDTGYIGNLGKQKQWHRVVVNGMQHTTPRYDLPADRLDVVTELLERNTGSGTEFLRFQDWQPEGKNILLVTPSPKPCKFYGVDRDQWVEETIAELKKYTGRNIIIRDKAEKRIDRVKDKSIFHQFQEDEIYAVVTYNSIAAIEAISYGIPAFTLAPTAADDLCLKTIKDIENPYRPDKEQVVAWQNWLSYCQYSKQELRNGSALRIIEEYELK